MGDVKDVPSELVKAAIAEQRNVSEPETLQIGHFKIPAKLLHDPAIESGQLAKTFREGDFGAIVKDFFKGTPGLGAAADIQEASSSNQKLSLKLADMAARIVEPEMLYLIAKRMDTEGATQKGFLENPQENRKASTVGQVFEKRIPELRKLVPTKEEAAAQKKLEVLLKSRH